MGRKWNNIKMKKEAADRKRGASYTKILQEITMSVKGASGDPDVNFALRVALQKAKTNNVPKDNIDRAITKGLGDDMSNWHEVNYEGYGIDGVGVFVEALTDNNTRTISNIRSYFKKTGGAVGKEGCLQFVFERKAIFTLKDEGQDLEELELALIDAGAEEIEKEEDHIIIQAAVEDYGNLYKKLESMGIEPLDSGLERLSTSTKEVLDVDNYNKIMKLVDNLEMDDDVQTVYHNMEYNEAFDV